MFFSPRSHGLNNVSLTARKLTAWLLVFLFVVTPLHGLLAEELVPETVPVDQEEVTVPAETAPEEGLAPPEEAVEGEPAETEEIASDEEADTEKPKEESQERMSLIQPSAGLQFQIPAQPKAQVDESTGALTYKYPIALPEGRAGMTPELSLTYNSRKAARPDSITGLGWEVSIPYIQREPGKGTQDLFNKAYFSSSLSGSLIATTDTSSSQYTVYRPETDDGSYFKYTYNSDNTWTVAGKDGRTYTFGGTSAARQDKPGDSSKVYKWMLSKVADTHGNEIQYSYIKDNNQIYPSQILYTYHASAAAPHRVDFSYTTPTGFGSTVYNAGFAVATYKLLNTITVTTTMGADTGIDTYTLSYADAQFLKQKNLTSIQKTVSFPSFEYTQAFNDTTSFAYSTKTPGWEQGSHSLASEYTLQRPEIVGGTYTADFDNNGYADILVSTISDEVLYQKFLLNSGSAFTESSSAWSLPSHEVGLFDAIVDVNGDRLPDLHPRGGDSSYDDVYLNTGSGFSIDTSDTWKVGTYVSEAALCGPNVGDAKSNQANTFLSDINGDDKNDIIHFGGTSDFQIWLNNGDGYTQSYDYSFTPASGASFDIDPMCGGGSVTDYQTLIDVNGDGLADYVNQRYGTFLNTGSGFAYNAAYNLDTSGISRSGFADINGDGLVDYMSFKYHGNSPCTRVHLNTGAGFTMVTPSNTTQCGYTALWNPDALMYTDANTAKHGRLMDVTADGYPDIIGAQATSTPGKVRSINNSKDTWTTNADSNWSPIVSPAYGVFFDINSDSIMDYITPYSGWSGSWSSRVYMGKGSIPNLLNQVTTPLGAQTTVSYKTEATNQSDSQPSPISVVDKITIQNIGQNQPTMVSRYSYAGGEYVTDTVTGQKKFTGFHKVTRAESGADLSTLRTTETYFHQANGSDSSTNEPTDDNLALIGRPYYSITKHPTGTPKKESWNTYDTYTLATDPVTDQISQFVFPLAQVGKTTDSGGSIGTAEAYAFDTTLGEQTEVESLGFVTVASDGTYSDISGDSRYQITEYVSNGSGTLVKPKREDIRTSAGSGVVSRTDYYYDSQSYGSMGSYGDVTKETSWISGNGSVTGDVTYTYDTYGNVLTETNPRGATMTYTYDSTKSLMASATNHLNHTTSYEYLVGRLKKITDPNGRTITYTYSSKGWPYKTTEKNTGGNRIKKQWLDSGGPADWRIENEEQLVSGVYEQYWEVFDNLGRSTRLIKRERNHTTNSGNNVYLKEFRAYDALGRQITTSAAYGTSDTNYYNLITTSVPSSLVTTTSFDVFDRPLSVVNSIGTTSFAYAGNETTVTDANGVEKDTRTDAYGNLIAVDEHNDGDIYTTEYEYDTRNLLTGITDALGNIRNFTYNNAGWVTESEDLHASGDSTFGTYEYTYDLGGNRLTETQPTGTVVTRAYDMLDRPTSIDSSSTAATDYTFTYDSCTNGKGHVCAVSGTLPNSVTLSKTYVYGISGVPTSVSLTTLGTTYTTAYQYNYSDEVKQVIYPNTTKYRVTYGEWAQPANVYITLPGQSEALYASSTYHFSEQPAQVTVTNGPTTTYTYDAAKLYRKTNAVSVIGGTTVQSFAYTYDGVGNILSVTEPNVTKTYSYDDLNRLIEAVHTPSGGGPATTFDYEYNEIGNILTANGDSYTYAGTGTTNPHAVTSVGADSYTYDDNGNIATAPNQSFTFNWQNQPESIVVGGTTNITAAYDEGGMRFIYQTPTNTEVQAADSYLVRNGTPEISIALGCLPVGVISGGALHSTIADHLGSPVKQVNSSGTVTEETSYGPFGETLSHSGTIDVKNGYTGHEEDIDTGLVYANARYYNAGIGRFVSQDRAFLVLGDKKFFEDRYQRTIAQHLLSPQALNSYSYAHNNPLMYRDQSGEVVQLVAIGVIVWAAIEMGLSIYDAYSTYKTLVNPNASMLDKATSLGLFGLGVIGPGGGYKTIGSKADDVSRAVKIGIDVMKVSRRYNWGNVGRLLDHTRRHASDFGLASDDYVGYASKAQEFGVRARKEGLEAGFNPVEDSIQFYDKSTNTFGAYNPSSGSSKTFLKPSAGSRYIENLKKRGEWQPIN